MVIDKIQEFYLNGFIQVSLKKDNTWKKLIKELKSIQDDNLKPGFQLKSKYKGAMDLSPNVYDYSNVFLDLLKVNEIPELLFQLTQKTNICYHIQIRKTLFGGSSYLSKHRDSFIKKGEIIGNIPPPIKIIFYPNFDNRKSRKLSVNTGSHLRFFKSFYLDKLINFFSKNEIIESSNSSILIFNTMLYHSIFKEDNLNGSLRLIYSFGDDNILKNYEHNQKLINIYKHLKHND